MVVRLNLNEATHPLGAPGAGIENLVTLRNRAGVDADEDKLADELVGPKFEGESTELALVVGRSLKKSRLVILTHSLRGRNLHRARKVINDGVEKVLNTLVLEGGTPNHRHDRIRNGRTTERTLDVRGKYVGLVEIHHAELVINISQGLKERLAGSESQFKLIFRQLGHLVGRTEKIVIGVNHRLEVDHIDLTLE